VRDTKNVARASSHQFLLARATCTDKQMIFLTHAIYRIPEISFADQHEMQNLALYYCVYSTQRKVTYHNRNPSFYDDKENLSKYSSDDEN